MLDLPEAGIVIVLLIAFLIYRRSRRLFVRQRYSRTRLVIRLVFIGALGAFLAPLMVLAEGALPVVAGLVLGLVIGLVSTHLTRFDRDGPQIYFKPNGWIGILLLSLLLGRIAYRLTRFRDFDGQLGSPLTAGILFLLLGYYFGYAGSLIFKGEALPATGT